MPTIKKAVFVFIALVALSINSCKKDNAHCNTQAVMYDRGPIATDGCGWVIWISGTDYHVDNLPTAYQRDSMPVWISYTSDTSRHYRCGLASLPMPTIVLSCIEQR